MQNTNIVDSSLPMVRLELISRFMSGNGFPVDRQGIEGEKYPFYKVGSLSSADREGFLTDTRNSVSDETAAELGVNIIPSGSIVLAKIGEAMRLLRLAFNKKDCCIDNNMLSIQGDDSKVDSKYLRYCLHTLPINLMINAGPVPSMNMNALRDFHIPLLSLETQQRIADYLDKETSEIDEMIESLEGLVGDLDNRKFQIVDDVLHGKVRVLNRESVDFAPLWKFAEVNPLTPEINQLDESEMVAFVPLEDVYPQNAKDDFGKISLGGNIASYTRFRNGDVLLPKVSPTVWHGRAMIADTNTPVGLASSEVHVLRAYEGINTRWIQLHFLSKSFLDEVRGELTGVAGLQRVSPLFIRNMKMMSISREEQDEIVAYLDEELTDLIEMLEQCSGLIEDLKARRSALITEVVSGRKEV